MVFTPAITAIVAAVFALVVLRQYTGHRKTYQLMWATGFAMFAIAAFAGYLAQSSGATETEYRLFYLFGAILNVAWLALGTTYLLAPRRWADMVLVLSNGAIVDQGTHAELLARCDLYRRIFAHYEPSAISTQQSDLMRAVDG